MRSTKSVWDRALAIPPKMRKSALALNVGSLRRRNTSELGGEADVRRARCEPTRMTHMRHQCWSQIGPKGTFVSAGSLRFEASELDHLGPFLGFIRYQFSKISRRARKHHTGALNETLD